MIVFKRYFNYFEISMNHTPSSFLYFLITHGMEMIPLTSSFYLSSIKLRRFFTSGNRSIKNNVNKTLYDMSLIPWFTQLLSIEHSQRNEVIFLFIVFFLLVLLAAYFFFSSSTFLRKRQLNRTDNFKSKVQDIFKKIFCIIIDTILCRILAFWIIYGCLLSILKPTGNTGSYFIVIFAIILLCLFVSFEIFYFKYTFVYIQFDKSLGNYPYDEFSSGIDILTLITKIFLALSFNASYFLDFSLIWVFCTIAIFGFLFFYFIRNVGLTLLDESFVLFYRNTKNNSVRIVVLCFNTIIGIALLFFDVSHSLCLELFEVIACLSFCCYLTKILIDFQFEKVVKGKNVLNRVFFIIDRFTNNRDEELEYMINHSFIFHTNHCTEEIKNCEICEEAKKKIKHEPLKIITLFYNFAKKKKFISSRMKVETISTYIMINNTNDNYYLINKFYSKTIFRLFEEFPVLSMNIMCYFNQLLTKNENDVRYVDQILMIENQNNLMKDFMNFLKNNLLTNSSITPENLIVLAENLTEIKSKINKKMFNRIDSKPDYHLIIMKYVYDTILNKKMKSSGVGFNFSFFDEMLNEHYTNDNFFLLNYLFLQKKIAIIRTGKDYSTYSGDQFKSLFFFGNFALANLKEKFKVVNTLPRGKTGLTVNPGETSLVNPNKVPSSIFEFPIKDPKKPEYITSFRMYFKVYPTIDLSSFLIFGVYQMKFSQVVLTLYDPSILEEKIVSFSSTLSENFIISPKLIFNLIQADKCILFNDVFSFKIRQNTGTSTKREEAYIPDKKYYIFDYKKYIPILKERVTGYYDYKTKEHTGNEDEDDELEVLNTIQNFNIKDKTHYNEFTLVSQRRYYGKHKEENINSDFDSDCYVGVYCFRKIGGNQDKENIYIDSNYSDNDFKMLHSFGTSMKNTVDQYFSKSSATINMSGTSGKKGSNKNYEQFQQYQKAQKIKKRQYHQFSFFTIFLLIYNILLIGITFVFLGMEISTNSAFQNTYSFYSVWSRFFRLFFNMTISLFFNYCPARYGINECKNTLDVLGAKYGERLGFDEKFTLKKYAFDEYYEKVSAYPGLLNEIRENAYKKGDANMVSVLESSMLYYYVENDKGTLTLNYQNTTFLNSLSIYYTLLNNIAETKDFQSLPIQPFSFRADGTIDFGGIKGIKRNSSKANAYNIILNYRRFMQRSVEFSDELVTVLNKDIFNIKFIGIFFLCFLIGNHIILIFICICIIGIFRRMLKKHCEDLLEKLSNMILTKALNEKIGILTQMCGFYAKNPNELNLEYEKLKLMYKASVNPENIDAFGASPHPELKINIDSNISQEIIKNCKTENFHNILRNTRHVIINLFGAFFIFSLIYLTILIWSLNTYSGLINTFSIHSSVDENVYSMISIFQIMIYTNQTDKDMLTLYKDKNNEIGYINYKVRETYQYLFQLEKSESPHQNEVTPIRNIIDLDCFSFYKQMGERIITRMANRYERDYGTSDFLFDSLGKICQNFEFTKYKNDKLWINEIIYRISNLNDKLEYNYDSLFAINSSEEFFDLYLIVLFVFRPVRNYESTSLFKDFIKNVTNNYTVVVYTYLILNIFFEVTLFAILRKFVINRFLSTNRSMVLLAKCLQV